MSLTYFKRFRMEIDLAGRDFSQALAPRGYRLIPWAPELLETHAETKFHCFRYEVDSNVFPCLGEPAGCLRLMREIANKPGFLPAATWLLAYVADRQEPLEYCGTVQGIRDSITGMGSVQNLGITPEHRHRGLASLLMYKSLDGFRQSGLRRASLEVTARNTAAVQLYRRLGFTKARTVYKAVEVAYV
jgi:ribosomal protein S18 acetylase RimI-like enzyme